MTAADRIARIKELAEEYAMAVMHNRVVHQRASLHAELDALLPVPYPDIGANGEPVYRPQGDRWEDVRDTRDGLMVGSGKKHHFLSTTEA